jgi:mannose-6-phosphate isomerase-like protein (cupin superfamily)
VLGAPTSIKLAGTDCGDRLAIVHVTVPRLAGPPLHRHSREDEWFYVLDGEITWVIDGRRLSGGPGTAAFAARGTTHTFQNFGSADAHMLVAVAPAGLERWFAEVAAMNAGRDTPDLSEVEASLVRYGVELLGPPLAS